MRMVKVQFFSHGAQVNPPVFESENKCLVRHVPSSIVLLYFGFSSDGNRHLHNRHWWLRMNVIVHQWPKYQWVSSIQPCYSLCKSPFQPCFYSKMISVPRDGSNYCIRFCILILFCFVGLLYEDISDMG